MLQYQRESGQYETGKREYSKKGQEKPAYRLVGAAVALCIGLLTFTSHTSLLPHVITHLQLAVLLAGSSLQLPPLHIQDAEGREWEILLYSTKME